MSDAYRAWLAARFEYDRALRRLLDGDESAHADIERLAAMLLSGFGGHWCQDSASTKAASSRV